MNSSEVAQWYRYIFYDLADPQSRECPLMGLPNDFLLLLLIFVLFFGFLLPGWLKNCSLEKVKNVTIWAFFVYAMAVLIFMIKGSVQYMYSFHFMKYYKLWNLPEPDQTGYIDYAVIFLLVRVLQLFEITFFMMIPSKGFTAKFLIYHHILFPMLVWFTFNYYSSTFGSFFIFINIISHAIVATYKVLCFYFKSIATRNFKNKFMLYLEIFQSSTSLAHAIFVLIFREYFDVPVNLLYWSIAAFLIIFVPFFYVIIFKKAEKEGKVAV